MINSYGKMYSVGELIRYGYASLVSGGIPPIDPINMLSYFQPMPCKFLFPNHSSHVLTVFVVYGPSIPTINPLTGGFIGGIRTNYDSFVIPKYPRRYTNMKPTYETEEEEEEEEEEDEYEPPSYPQNDYKQRRPYSYSARSSSKYISCLYRLDRLEREHKYEGFA